MTEHHKPETQKETIHLHAVPAEAPTVPFAQAKTNQALDPKTVAETQGEATVKMRFPHRVLLTVELGQVIDFPAGVHDVPVSLSDHWYLKQNGVTTDVTPEHDEEYVRTAGTSVKSPEQRQRDEDFAKLVEKNKPPKKDDEDDDEDDAKQKVTKKK